MKKSLLLFFIGAYYTQIFAQNASPKSPQTPVIQAIGKISGQVLFLQENKKQAVAFANVLAFRMKDSTMISGALADVKGNFEITKLPLGGTYFLQIQAIGFKKTRFGKFAVSMREPEIEAGIIEIKESQQTLKEVVVKGQKDETEYRLDKRVYNVKQFLNSAGGTAVDALQNIPSLTVESDGSIQLRGSEKVMVLIDGKPSSLTGNDRQAILNQIPASIIESVEVITSPSAKYDAESTAGIINIITKREKQAGFNALASFTAGNRDKYNGSLNLNFRQNRWNFIINYDQLHDNRYAIRDANRKIFGTGINTFLTENEYLEGYSDNHNIKFGTDFYASKRKTFSANVLIKTGSGLAESNTNSVIYNEQRLPFNYYKLNSIRKDRENSQDFTLGYRQTFPKIGKEWTIDLVYLQGDFGSFNDLNRKTYPSISEENKATRLIWQNDISSKFYTFTAQTDFVFPTSKTGKLETGLKLTKRENDAVFNFNNYVETDKRYVLNPRQSNRFIFDESVFAGYINLTNQYKKLNYSLGLRAEQTNQQGDQRAVFQSGIKDYAYFNLFPSANLNYQISEKQRLNLGFTRRINRPAYGVLNPFIVYGNPQNIVAGNDKIQPELVNSLEIGHLGFTKKGSISTTLFYRYTNGQVARIRTVVDSLRDQNVTVMTFNNVDDRISYGLEMVANQSLTKAWRLNANLSAFHTEFKGNPQGVLLNSSFNSFTARMTNSFKFGKDWELQLIGVYRSPLPTVQGRVKDVYFMDFGAKKDILKGKGTVNLRLSDVFNTLRFDVEVEGKDFFMNNPLKRESQIIYLGFTYRFSQKLKATERRERKAVNENRAGEGEQ